MNRIRDRITTKIEQSHWNKKGYFYHENDIKARKTNAKRTILIFRILDKKHLII